MSVEVGTAYLTVVPSAKGFAGKLQSELGSGMASAGAKAGDDASKSFGTRFKGGVVNAAKGGALALAGALAVGIGFAKDAVAEARESQKVGARTENVIKSTGGAAKVTAQQVGDLATAISNKTGIDDEAIQSGANMLLTFKNIRNEAGKGNDIFNQSTSILTDMASAMGSDPQKAAIQLGKALNDPIKGVSALGRVGVTFTDQQKKTIKSLVDGGKTAEAQKIILGELKSEFGGAAEASATMGEKLSTSFGNFKEQIGTALLPVIDKVEKVLVEKVIPGVSNFITEMQNGTGKGGAFVNFLKDIGNAAKTVFHWIKESLWPALQQGYQTIFPALKQAFSIISGAFKSSGSDGKGFGDTIKKVGDFITKTLIPVIAKIAQYYLPFWATQIRVVVEAVKILWGVFKTLLSIVGSVISFILRRFADLSGMWAGVLRALSKVPGFGWAKDAADKLDRASGKANALASSIERIPNRKSVTIDVNARVMTGRIQVGNQSVNVGMRASGGPVAAGRPYVVGEHEPELFVPKTSGTILNQSQIAAMRGGGGMSRADVDRLVAALEGANLRADISAGTFDRAMGGTLR